MLPKAAATTDPPICIGGSGERHTLQRAARLLVHLAADALTQERRDD